MKPRVAIVALGIYPIRTGGAEIHAYQQAVGLTRNGASVFVFTKLYPGKASRAQARRHHIAMVGSRLPGLKQILFVAGTLAYLLRLKGRIDLVHVHYATYFPVPAFLFHLITSKPYLVTCHGADIAFYGRNRMWKWAERWLLSFAAAITTTSNALVQILENDYGLAAAKISVIPNGLDQNEIEGIASHETGSRHNKVIFVGNLRPVKDPFTALEGFRLALAKDSGLRLTIVGDGPSRFEVLDAIRKLGMEAYVTLKGSMQHRATLEEMARSDVLILTSLFEGGNPLVLLEAMALGKPVIATSVGGVTDLIKQEFNGILIPPRSPEALSNSLLRVLSDVGYAQKLAMNAKRSVSKCSWEQTIVEYESVYTTLLAGGAS